MKERTYVVLAGRRPGLYLEWEDAKEQVDGFPGAIYKGYDSRQEALKVWRAATGAEGEKELQELLAKAGERRAEAAATRDGNEHKRTAPKQRDPSEWLRFSEIDPDGWAVDASCLGNPGVMEYRCVELRTGREVFRGGPFPMGTNNIGEFLAIVHALALMARNNDWHTLYSDSRTAMGWVRRRQPKTTLQRNEKTQRLYEVLARAMLWVRSHDWPVKVLKWDTDRWGEIPADFSRK